MHAVLDFVMPRRRSYYAKGDDRGGVRRRETRKAGRGDVGRERRDGETWDGRDG